MMNPMEGMSMMGGPTITGKWTHKNTGETINVRDSFIMDDNMQIMLDNGTIMDMDEFSKYYVQIGDEEFDAPKIEKGFEIPKEDVDQNNWLDKPLDEISHKASQQTKETYLEKQTNSYAVSNSADGLIDKIFKKLEIDNETSSKPDINLTFKWDAFPKNELNMLINFFDVSKEDIATYLYVHYFNSDSIINTISKKLDTLLK